MNDAVDRGLDAPGVTSKAAAGTGRRMNADDDRGLDARRRRTTAGLPWEPRRTFQVGDLVRGCGSG
jgi:hypothetical protein